MIRKAIHPIVLLLAAGLAACNDTWLEYDTSQKDRLYFKYEELKELDQYLSTDVSFALKDESVSEQPISIPVTLIGMVADHDRAFAVKAIHDTTSYYTSGGVHRELVDAVEGEDYTLGRLVIPAGAVAGEIPVTVKRTDKIRTKTASLVLQIEENELFEGVPRNVYRILISDGEPACPPWWYSTSTLQWYQYLGIFTTDKYRRLLDFYHGIADTNPALYKKMVEQFGEQIDKEYYTTTSGTQAALSTGFMVRSNNPQKLAWVRYVLCPMFDYYSTHYPDAEVYTDKSVNTTTLGWRNPDYNY